MKEGQDFEGILARVAPLAREVGAPLSEDELRHYLPRLRRYLREPERLRVWFHSHPVGWRIRFVQGLNERCLTEARKSPRQAEDAARLAEAAADALLLDSGFRALAYDLRAEAASWLANAFRLQDNYTAARATYRRVGLALLAGSGDPLLRAEIEERHSALFIDLALFPKAASLLRRSARTFRLFEEKYRGGRAALQLSRVLYFSGQPGPALAQLCTAIAALEEQSDSITKMLSLFGILACLEEMKEPLLAFALLNNMWDTARYAAPPSMLRDLRWLRGRLHNTLNSPEGARYWLEPVRQELIAEGRTLDAALCSLDLALAYAQSRAWLPQKRLAEEMLPIFQSLEVEREALAALLLYVNAAQEYDASAQLVQQVIESTQPLRKGGEVRTARAE